MILSTGNTSKQNIAPNTLVGEDQGLDRIAFAMMIVLVDPNISRPAHERAAVTVGKDLITLDLPFRKLPRIAFIPRIFGMPKLPASNSHVREPRHSRSMKERVPSLIFPPEPSKHAIPINTPSNVLLSANRANMCNEP